MVRPYFPYLLGCLAALSAVFARPQNDIFAFTAPLCNISLEENARGTQFASCDDAVRMGVPLLHNKASVNFKIVEGDKNHLFKAHAKQIGDFVFLRIRQRDRNDVPLNRDIWDRYEFVVKATRKRKDSGNLETTARVRLRITDRSDASPMFTLEADRYESEISEKVPPFSPVLQVEASDADIGVNGQIYYSMVNHSTEFTVDPISGWIKTLRTVRPGKYDFQVRAEDLTSRLFYFDEDPNQPDWISDVLITVTEAKKQQPKLLVEKRPVAPHNIKEDQLAAIIHVEGGHDPIHVGLLEDDIRHWFLLNQTDDPWELRTVRNQFIPTGTNVTVVAGSFAHGETNTSATIKIDFVEQHSIAFNPSRIELEVEENAPVVFVLGRISALCSNPRELDVVRYHMESIDQNTTLPFRLSEKTGVLRLARSIEFENKKSYEFTVFAKLVGFGEQALVLVEVRILDSNDHAPVFPAKWARQGPISILPTTSIGSVLIKVNAIDQDEGENALISYKMVSDANSPLFVNISTGEIILSSPLSKTPDEWKVTIFAVDAGKPFSRSSSINLVFYRNGTKIPSKHRPVIVSEASNSHAPEFTSSSNSISIPEDLPVGEIVANASASDSDVGYSGVVRFTTWNDYFQVDSVTGEVRTAADLTQLLPPGKESVEHKIAIISSDLGVPPKTTKKKIAVNIRDVNNNALVFDRSWYRVKISEDAAVGTTILKVSATDEDSRDNGRIRYSLAASDSALFEVDEKSGAITLRAQLDREQMDVISCTVAAFDHGSPQNFSFVNVFVVVLDVNDNPPICSQKLTKVRIPKDYPNLALVGCVSTTDADLGANGRVHYSILQDSSSFEHPPFRVDHHSGCVFINSPHRPLDYQHRNSYNLNIEVADNGDTVLSTVCYFLVELTDVNENLHAPEFDDVAHEASVFENMPVGTEFHKVIAFNADRKDAPLHFSIVGGDGLSFFSVDGKGRDEYSNSPYSTVTSSVVLYDEWNEGNLLPILFPLLLFVYFSGAITLWALYSLYYKMLWRNLRKFIYSGYALLNSFYTIDVVCHEVGAAYQTCGEYFSKWLHKCRVFVGVPYSPSISTVLTYAIARVVIRMLALLQKTLRPVLFIIQAYTTSEAYEEGLSDTDYLMFPFIAVFIVLDEVKRIYFLGIPKSALQFTFALVISVFIRICLHSIMVANVDKEYSWLNMESEIVVTILLSALIFVSSCNINSRIFFVKLPFIAALTVVVYVFSMAIASALLPIPYTTHRCFYSLVFLLVSVFVATDPVEGESLQNGDLAGTAFRMTSDILKAEAHPDDTVDICKGLLMSLLAAPLIGYTQTDCDNKIQANPSDAKSDENAESEKMPKQLGIVCKHRSKSGLAACLQLLAAVPEFTDLLKNTKTTLGASFSKFLDDLNSIDEETIRMDALLEELSKAGIYKKEIPEKYPQLDVTYSLELILKGFDTFFEEPLRSNFNQLFRHESVDRCTSCPEKKSVFYINKGDWKGFSYEKRSFPCTYCNSDMVREIKFIPKYSINKEYDDYNKFMASERFPEIGRNAKVIMRHPINKPTSISFLEHGAIYTFANEKALVSPNAEDSWKKTLENLDLEDLVIFSNSELIPTLHCPQIKEETILVHPLGEKEETFINEHSVRLVRFQNRDGICTIIATVFCLLQLPMKTMEILVRRSFPFPPNGSLFDTLGVVLSHWKTQGVDLDDVHPLPQNLLTAALSTGAIGIYGYEYGSTSRDVLENIFLKCIHPDILKYYVAVKEFKKGEHSLKECLEERPVTITLLPANMSIEDALDTTAGFTGVRVMPVESPNHAAALYVPNDRECLLLDNSSVSLKSVKSRKGRLIGHPWKSLKCPFIIGIEEKALSKKDATQRPLLPEPKLSREAWMNLLPNFEYCNFSSDEDENEESVTNLEDALCGPVFDGNQLSFDAPDSYETESPCSIAPSDSQLTSTASSDSQLTSTATSESQLTSTATSESQLTYSPQESLSTELNRTSDTCSEHTSNDNSNAAPEFVFGRGFTIYAMGCVLLDILGLEQDPKTPTGLIRRLYSSTLNCNGFRPKSYRDRLSTHTFSKQGEISVRTVGLSEPIIFTKGEIQSGICSHVRIDYEFTIDSGYDERKQFFLDVCRQILCKTCRIKEMSFAPLKTAMDIIGRKERKQPARIDEDYKITYFTESAVVYRNNRQTCLNIKPCYVFRTIDAPRLQPGSVSRLSIEMFKDIPNDSLFWDDHLFEVEFDDGSKECVGVIM